MAIVTKTTHIDLNLLNCANCGTEVIRFGEEMRIAIPEVRYECEKCNARGLFEMVYVDTTLKD